MRADNAPHIMAFISDLFSERSEVPYNRAKLLLEAQIEHSRNLGIWETQTWSNGLKSKEMWGPCFMHMGPSILAFWRPGGSIFGVLGHHFDASLLIQGHWARSTRHLGAQILIFADF